MNITVLGYKITLFELKVTRYRYQTEAERQQADAQYQELTAAMSAMSLNQRKAFVLSVPEFFPECIGISDDELTSYCK